VAGLMNSSTLADVAPATPLDGAGIVVMVMLLAFVIYFFLSAYVELIMGRIKLDGGENGWGLSTGKAFSDEARSQKKEKMPLSQKAEQRMSLEDIDSVEKVTP
jgi:hypothetical protein